MALFLLSANLGWVQGHFNFTETSLRYRSAPQTPRPAPPSAGAPGRSTSRPGSSRKTGFPGGLLVGHPGNPPGRHDDAERKKPDRKGCRGGNRAFFASESPKRVLFGVFCAQECRKERHDLLPGCGDIAVHDHPDLIRVHAEVCVNQNIPKTYHLFPGNAGRNASKVIRETGGCFPDDLEMMHHPDLHQFVLKKRIPAPDPYRSSLRSLPGCRGAARSRPS